MKMIPSKNPQTITYSQYEQYTPEKLELIKGNLLWSEQERLLLKDFHVSQILNPDMFDFHSLLALL
jgi:hypothetical protein